MLYLVPAYERPAYHQCLTVPVNVPFGYDYYGYNYNQYEYERLLELQRQQQLIERQRQLLALRKREQQRQKRRDAQRVMSILALAEDIYHQLYETDIDQVCQGDNENDEMEIDQEKPQESAPTPGNNSTAPTPGNNSTSAQESVKPNQEQIQPSNPVQEAAPEAQATTKISIPIEDGNEQALPPSTAQSDCGKSESGKSVHSDQSFSMIEMLRQKSDPVIINE